MVVIIVPSPVPPHARRRAGRGPLLPAVSHAVHAHTASAIRCGIILFFPISHRHTTSTTITTISATTLITRAIAFDDAEAVAAADIVITTSKAARTNGRNRYYSDHRHHYRRRCRRRRSAQRWRRRLGYKQQRQGPKHISFISTTTISFNDYQPDR